MKNASKSTTKFEKVTPSLCTYIASKSALASFYQISPKKAAELVAELEPVTTERGHPMYLLSEASLLIAQYKLKGNDNPASSGDGAEEKDEAYWKTLERKIKVQKLQGELVEVDDFRQKLHRLFKAVSNALQSFPQIAANKHGADPDIVSKLEQMADSGLQHVHDVVTTEFEEL